MSNASKRGIAPEILYSHIENTMPFLFKEMAPLTPFTKVVIENKNKKNFAHVEYFELCLCAHYSTVATFVPTDVDNQIRKHLWETSQSNTEIMAELCLKSLAWDFRPVTARYQEANNYYVCGHQGEWFSVAVGAYAAHIEKNPTLAAEIQSQIIKEVEAEADIFADLKRAKNGIGLLRACTAIAHNLGDLDRVIDQWNLPEENSLRRAVYKLGHTPNADFKKQSLLLEAGALNKAFMASENHRHYPLRKPKCLRRSIDLILPLGPFFDEWGATVAKHPLLTPAEVSEVVQALLDGFDRLSSPQVPLYGYARAIGGIAKNFSGGPKMLMEYLPSKDAKKIQSGLIAQIIQTPQFYDSWAKKAVAFLKI